MQEKIFFLSRARKKAFGYLKKITIRKKFMKKIFCKIGSIYLTKHRKNGYND